MITPQEKKIVEKIIKKDQKAFFIFYQKYKKTVFNFINRHLKNPLDAEELTQDCFLDFIEALRGFHGQCCLKTFLFSIAKRKVIDEIRKRKIKKILFSKLPEYFINNFKTILIDEEIERNELKKKIEKTFKKLPKEYQLVLRLKYMEGEKVKTIAKKLAKKFKATESLIFRARQTFIRIFNTLK